LLNTLVLAFFDFSSTQTLIQLPISQMQIAFIAASLVWYWFFNQGSSVSYYC